MACFGHLLRLEWSELEVDECDRGKCWAGVAVEFVYKGDHGNEIN